MHSESAPRFAETTESQRRLVEVNARSGQYARECGRDPQTVELIAVSKTFPAAEILPILEAGQRVFGENYVQEAKAKWPPLREQFPKVELHLVGPLQSNKARAAVALFDVIQSLDRESLAREIASEIGRQSRAPRLFVQVNTGEEPQKGGVLPAEVDSFLQRCREVHGLKVTGLMCIPPADEPPSPHFALLSKISRLHGIAAVSMGMSADFGEAIQLGATHIRVGSAIFGSRS